MGLFTRKPEPPKQPPIDETTDGVQRFFDGYFSELRERGRAQFDKTLEDNAAAFKKDLDGVIAKANAELKEHIAQQLEAQFMENNRTMKAAQDTALETLNQSTATLQQQHRELSVALQKSTAEHQQILAGAFEENKAQIAELKEAHDTALRSLMASVQALEEQHRQLSTQLQQNVANQEAMLVSTFEENMAQIIEHYLLGALGDQYDLKAQLPAIIQQMEQNKQAIVDDMEA